MTSMVADRHGLGAVAETLHLVHRKEVGEGRVTGPDLRRAIPSDMSRPSAMLHLQILTS